MQTKPIKCRFTPALLPEDRNNRITPNQELVDAIAKGVRKAEDEEWAEQANAWGKIILIGTPILLLIFTFPWSIAIVVLMFQGNPLLSTLIFGFAIWCYIKIVAAVFN